MSEGTNMLSELDIEAAVAATFYGNNLVQERRVQLWTNRAGLRMFNEAVRARGYPAPRPETYMLLDEWDDGDDDQLIK